MKTKLILLLTVISFTYHSSAQLSKLSYNLELTPNISFAMLNNQQNVSGLLVSFYKDLEQPKFNTNFQCGVVYPFSSNSSLSFGLGYMQTGIVSESENTYIPPSSSPEPIVLNARLIDRFHSIQLPVNYQFQFSNNCYISSGLSGIFTLKYDRISKITDTDGKTTKSRNTIESDNLRQVNLGINVAFGYNFIRTSSYDFYLQPQGQIQVLGVMKDVGLNRNMLILGLTAGIRLKG